MMGKQTPSCDCDSEYIARECDLNRKRLNQRLSETGREHKTIRDPIQGLVYIGKKYIPIIDTCKFQRLRRVIQMGAVHLAYPGSHHTRFDHSIGVYHIAESAKHNISRNIHGFSNKETENIKKKLDLVPIAALLHDICHGPFSHASEEIWNVAAVLSGTYKKPVSHAHEVWTAEYLKETNCITDLVKKQFNLDQNEMEDIAGMIIERGIWKEQDRVPVGVHDIINGPLDVDKLDYYIRDSAVTGVPYGNIDLDRLLMFLSIRANKTDEGTSPELCISDRALISVKSMLVARELFYPSVVFHKVSYIADRMLIRCFEIVFERKIYTDVESDLFAFAESFRRWDDFRAWQYLRDIDKSRDEDVFNIVNSILSRKLFKKVEIKRPTKETSVWESIALEDRGAIKKVEKAIAEKAGIDPCYIVVKPDKITLSKPVNIYRESNGKIMKYNHTLSEDWGDRTESDELDIPPEGSVSDENIKMNKRKEPVVYSVSVFCPLYLLDSVRDIAFEHIVGGKNEQS